MPEEKDKKPTSAKIDADAFEREVTTDLDEETPDKPKGLALHTRILIGLAVGVIAGVSVNDVDGNLSTTRLTVGNGEVNVSLAGGATISAGANSSSTMTLSGTQAQINAALATIRALGTGAAASQSHVVGVGPEISTFWAKPGLFTSLRYVWEADAKDRPQGHTITLTLTKRL